jgi:alkyldihydroxyacetonephosphate synthase
VRAVTPRGTWESRRLPGSGAGPSPDRMLLGSEGILGAITDAWVRVRPRPEWKAGATVRFERFGDACEAVREIVQAGLDPANCRLLEAAEAEMTGAGDGASHLLLLAFESAHHPVDAGLAFAIEAAESHGGVAKLKQTDGDASDSWRGAFLLAPYLRDTFVSCGVLSETFETAITWDRLEEFHASVMEAARDAVAEVSGAPREGRGAPLVTCRFTHAYPDGVAPYFTVLAPAIRGGEVEQWDEVKAAVSEALIEGGGTITHHHAVGRDHRPWYDRQRPAPFAAALRAAKAELDPAAILNPGVLLDP